MRWSLQTSPFFDAAYNRREAELSAGPFAELMRLFESACKIDPRALGIPHPSFEPPERFWVYESPPILRMRRFALLYEIDPENELVRLWNVYFLS